MTRRLQHYPGPIREPLHHRMTISKILLDVISTEVTDIVLVNIKQTYQVFSSRVKLDTFDESLMSLDRYDDRDIADIEHPNSFLAEEIVLTSELVDTGV